MNNVLIYYPPNKPSNAIETIAKCLVEKNCRVFLLTQTEAGDLHEEMERNGVVTAHFSIPKKNAFVYYIRHVLFLISFCRKNKIALVESHLQQANIVAVLAQYFIKAKVVLFRHHYVEADKMSEFFDKIINRLGKCIVSPSIIIIDKMIKEEHVPEYKIKHIPYIYDFPKYPKPSEEIVKKIREQYPCKMLILLCSRFVPVKRNMIAFQALNALIAKGYDIKLVALDEGPELEACKQYVSDHRLEAYAFFPGYSKHVVNYIAACDVLAHPSYSEASNNIVKEAALYSKNVIVCEQVGDFSDYIEHLKNGYITNKEAPLEEIIQYLEKIYLNNDASIGNALRETVYNKFHLSDKIIQEHLNLLKL